MPFSAHAISAAGARGGGSAHFGRFVFWVADDFVLMDFSGVQQNAPTF